MNLIIKKSPETSLKELLGALDRFIPFLKTQNEMEAVLDLEKAQKILSSAPLGSKEAKDALNSIFEAFEGEHDLNVYTLHRETKEWTEKEELAQVSSRVLTLTKRLLK